MFRLFRKTYELKPINTCIDCKHCTINSKNNLEYCVHPIVASNEDNVSRKPLCSGCRVLGVCGKRGRYFEPKEAENG